MFVFFCSFSGIFVETRTLNLFVKSSIKSSLTEVNFIVSILFVGLTCYVVVLLKFNAFFFILVKVDRSFFDIFLSNFQCQYIINIYKYKSYKKSEIYVTISLLHTNEFF